MISGISNFLINLDTLGPRPKFTIKSKENYKTFYGTLLTLASIVMSFVVIQFTISNFLNKTNPSVYETSTYYDGIPLEFNNTNVPVFFNVKFRNSTTNKFQILPLSLLERPIFVYAKQESTLQFIDRPSPLADCGDDIFLDYRSGLLDDAVTQEQIDNIRNNSFCFPANKSYSFETNLNSQTIIQLALPKSLFDLWKSYDEVAFSVNYRKLQINPNSFDNTTRMLWTESFIFGDEDRLNTFELNIANSTVTKDNTILLTQDLDVKYFPSGYGLQETTSISRANVNLKVTHYAMVSMAKMERSMTTLIKFTTLGNVIQEFGGLFAVVVALARFILLLFINHFYETTIVNEIFRFHQGPNTDEAYRKFKEKFLKKEKLNTKDNFKDVLILEENLQLWHKKSMEMKNFFVADKKDQIPQSDNDLMHSTNLIKINDGFLIYGRKTSDKGFHLSDLQGVKRNIKLNRPECRLLFCAKSNQTIKEKVLKKCLGVILNSTEITNLIKTHMELQIFRNIMLNKFERQACFIPSINLNKENSTLKQFKIEERIDYNALLEYYSLTDMTERKNRKIMKLFVKSNT